MTQDQFTKLFKYIEEFRSEVDKRFETQDEKIDNLYKLQDRNFSKLEDIVTENAVRDEQDRRIQRWIFQLADKTGVQLKYE